MWKETIKNLDHIAAAGWCLCMQVWYLLSS